MSGGDAGRVLVTGGAGYIGAHVARACLEQGHDVVILDDGSTGHDEAAARIVARAPAGRRVDVVGGQVGDASLVCGAVREFGIGACIHLAGSSLVGESVAQPLAYYRNNVAQGVALLEALLGCGVRDFVFSSSAAVYGHPGVVPIGEDQPRQPISPYGETKAVLETVLEGCARAYGLRYFALRYFNAAGADRLGDLGEDHRPESHLIPLAVDVALGLRPSLTVFGDDYATPDGTAIRDYVHVCDLAAAHVAAIGVLRRGGAGGCVNLGNQRGHSVLEVVRAVEAAAGGPVGFEIGPRRAGDPPVLVASGERAGSLFPGWAQRPGLEAMVASALAWRRRHPRGYGA